MIGNSVNVMRIADELLARPLTPVVESKVNSVQPSLQLDAVVPFVG